MDISGISYYVNPNNRTLTTNRKNTAILESTNFLLFKERIDNPVVKSGSDDAIYLAREKEFYTTLLSKIKGEESTKESVDFSKFAPNAPHEVKQAFMEASEKTGYREYSGNEMIRHISQILVTQMENRYNGVSNPQDVFGSSVASALQAAKQMLYDLENPFVSVSQRGENVAKYVEQEKEFYRRFIEKLETI